jgi:hypothetical protein
MIGSAVVWFLYILSSRGADLRKVRDVSAAVLAIGLAGLTWSAIVFQDRIENTSPQNRFERGFRFLSEGAAADRNAAGRIEGWSRALRFHEDHLLGTMGEPRFLFRDIVDNDYVRALLQGSLVCLITVWMALYGAFRQLTRRTNIGWLMGLSAVVVGINAMTAHPLSYSAITVFWMAIGFHLYLAATSQSSERRSAEAERLPGESSGRFVPTPSF